MNVTLLQFDYSSSNGISGDRERLEKLSIFAILLQKNETVCCVGEH